MVLENARHNIKTSWFRYFCPLQSTLDHSYSSSFFSQCTLSWDNTTQKPTLANFNKHWIETIFFRTRVNLRQHKAGSHRKVLHWMSSFEFNSLVLFLKCSDHMTGWSPFDIIFLNAQYITRKWFWEILPLRCLSPEANFNSDDFVLFRQFSLFSLGSPNSPNCIPKRTCLVWIKTRQRAIERLIF